MRINEIQQMLNEISQDPEILAETDTKMEKVLKEIIKIERRYLYGMDSTSAAKRKKAILEFLNEEFKTREQ